MCLLCCTTDSKVERKDSDSDNEEPIRGADSSPALPSQPQRVALFPGMDPSVLKVGGVLPLVHSDSDIQVSNLIKCRLISGAAEEEERRRRRQSVSVASLSLSQVAVPPPGGSCAAPCWWQREQVS